MNTFLQRHNRAILVLILAISFLLMLGASFHDGTIVDELAHIPAGYAYDHFLDYQLNPEHPPLLKALAALPLQFMNLQFPLTNPFWTSTANGEWGVGGAFLFGLGNNANEILRIARIFPMLLTLGLIVLAWWWARKLYGNLWALLPAMLLGLSPIILSHGHYVTTDIAAAFGALLGLIAFVKAFDDQRTATLWLAGIAFGVAQLMKFSDVLLAPVFIIAAIAWAIATMARDRDVLTREQRAKIFWKRTFGAVWRAILIMLIGTVFVIYPVYRFFTVNYPPTRQLSDTVAQIGAVASAPCNIHDAAACLAKFDITISDNHVFRPMAQYLLGIIMTMERIGGTNETYFLGHVSQYGSWLYFPVVYGLKETLPTLAIEFAGFAIGLWGIARAITRRQTELARYVLEHFAQFSMIIFVGLYWTWSILSPLNIGVRHILPTIPLMYLLATGALAAVWKKYETTHNGKNPFLGNVGLGILLAWLAIETGFAYPYYLSYFNEVGGGVWGGYHYVTDSNYDWGQDMLALQTWMNQNPQVDKLAFDFFGGSNPNYYLGNRYVPWQSNMGNPATPSTSSGQASIHYFAISINNLQLAIQPTADDYARNASDSYEWLLDARGGKPAGMGTVPTPDYRIGTTIFIYKL